MNLARFAAALPLAGLCALFAAGPAAATTSDVSPTGFVVTVRQEVQTSVHHLYESLGHIDKWWSPAHTWSGDASNLSLATQASACFCERWGKNSVEHARVVYAAEDSALRLQGGLGPLQGLAVNAVLTFAVAEKDGKTILRVTYRVAGSDPSGLQELAPAVDGVIVEQVRRLAKFAESGKPD